MNLSRKLNCCNRFIIVFILGTHGQYIYHIFKKLANICHRVFNNCRFLPGTVFIAKNERGCTSASLSMELRG